MADTIKINRKNARIIAHRGLSGIERENTNAAFVAAGNRSYWGIETDVHVAGDGTFVIIHDDNTERVAKKNIIVEESNFDALSALTLNDVVDGMERRDLCIPVLDEYIRICKKYDKIAVLELKNPMDSAHIKGIAEVIKKLDYAQNTVFISFCFENLAEIKNLDSHYNVQFLVCEWSEELPKLLAKNGMDLDIAYKNIDREKIELLHSMGIKVNVWTVNEKEDAENLIECGVDYITTNILE